MCRGTCVDTCERKHADDQQAREKILNTTNPQGNANQNHNEISLHTCQNGYYQKDKKYHTLMSMWKKRDPLCTIGGNVNCCSHYGKQYGDSTKN